MEANKDLKRAPEQMHIVEKGTEQMQCEHHTQHPQSNKCCLCRGLFIVLPYCVCIYHLPVAISAQVAPAAVGSSSETNNGLVTIATSTSSTCLSRVQKAAMDGASALQNHDVSAFDLSDWQYFDALILSGVCVKEAVATVYKENAAAAAHMHHDCSAFDMSDWQNFHESLGKNGGNVIDALTEVRKNKILQQNTTCVVLEENNPGTASTSRAEAMVFDAYMTRGYALEAEMQEAKKEFEEQVQLQEVKNFEARVKSFLEDK
jgi:hypothetical protein